MEAPRSLVGVRDRYRTENQATTKQKAPLNGASVLFITVYRLLHRIAG
jgi:hypothetical protein